MIQVAVIFGDDSKLKAPAIPPNKSDLGRSSQS
jgi:hypothetical protein